MCIDIWGDGHRINGNNGHKWIQAGRLPRDLMAQTPSLKILEAVVSVIDKIDGLLKDAMCLYVCCEEPLVALLVCTIYLIKW